MLKDCIVAKSYEELISYTFVIQKSMCYFYTIFFFAESEDKINFYLKGVFEYGYLFCCVDLCHIA